MTDEQLRPCPFCGAEVNCKGAPRERLSDVTTVFSIGCDCVRVQLVGSDQRSLIARWNQRKPAALAYERRIDEQNEIIVQFQAVIQELRLGRDRLKCLCREIIDYIGSSPRVSIGSIDNTHQLQVSVATVERWQSELSPTSAVKARST